MTAARFGGPEETGGSKAQEGRSPQKQRGLPASVALRFSQEFTDGVVAEVMVEVVDLLRGAVDVLGYWLLIVIAERLRGLVQRFFDPAELFGGSLLLTGELRPGLLLHLTGYVPSLIGGPVTRVGRQVSYRPMPSVVVIGVRGCRARVA